MSDERAPLQSKKFVAYLVAEITWKIALVVLLVMGIKEAKIDVFIGSVALAIVIIAGFIEAGYIIGQASLDKYLGVARIATQNGKAFQMKGLSVAHGGKAEEPKPQKKPQPPPAPVSEDLTDEVEPEDG